MEGALASSPAGDASTVRYAGFWRRLGADIVDNAILLLFLRDLTQPIPVLTRSLLHGGMLSQNMLRTLGADLKGQLIALLIGVAYSVFFWMRYLGTPGKLLFRCRVVDARTHAALTFSQSLLRNLGYIVSAIPCMLGFFWIAWDPRKQGFHDKIAGSVVLYAAPAIATGQRVS